MIRLSYVSPLRAWLFATLLAAGASPAFAASFTWNGPKIATSSTFAGGQQTWNNSANWTGDTSGTFPNGAEDVAQIRVNWGASPTLNLNQQITLKTLSIGDSATLYYPVTVASGSGGSLVFSSTTGTTTITKNNSINGTASTELRSDIISAGMSLMSDVFENRIQNTTGIGRLTFSGNVSAGSAGLKTIVHSSSATGSGLSYINYAGVISDGSGQIGITVSPASAGAIPFRLTGTANSFSGPVKILTQSVQAFPLTGTTGALGSGTLELGNTVATDSSATLSLGGSLETVTERNPIVVPEGSSGTRRIEVINVYGADNTWGGIYTSGNRILSGAMDVQNSGGVTLACSGTSSLTFSNAIKGAGPITISSTGSGKVIFSGTGSTHSGTVTIQSRGLQLAGGSALAASTIVPLAGGTMTLTPALQTTVGGLSPNAGGLTDVGSGYVTVAAGLSVADMLVALNAGRGDGSWSGTSGITSSTAAADVAASIPRTVGWLDNGDGSTTFAYAAPGDTNIDWQVDALDALNFVTLGKFDTGLQATWLEGDFNYDGVVDILDALDFFNTGLYDTGVYNPPAGAAGAVAAVPEPAGSAGAVIAAVILLLRQRAWRRFPAD
jgi:hypothetical protein